MAFGEVLAETRRSMGLSQHRLALASDTTQRHQSFLETGRSRPTREMILRLCDALGLQPGRRADLFEAAGYVSAYRRRPPDDEAIADAVRQLKRYILDPWPYPAMALTETWDVLGANGPARQLFGLPADAGDQAPNLFDILLNDRFRAGIANWTQVALLIQTRLRRHAASHPQFRGRLEEAIRAGVFAEAGGPSTDFEAAAILPMIFRFGDGAGFRMTSMSARLTSAQDDFVNGLEIELCVPLDDASAAVMRGGAS